MHWTEQLKVDRTKLEAGKERIEQSIQAIDVVLTIYAARSDNKPIPVGIDDVKAALRDFTTESTPPRPSVNKRRGRQKRHADDIYPPERIALMVSHLRNPRGLRIKQLFDQLSLLPGPKLASVAALYSYMRLHRDTLLAAHPLPSRRERLPEEARV